MNKILQPFLTTMSYAYFFQRLAIACTLSCVFFTLPKAQSQCSCERKLLYNGSFETGNTSGWNSATGNVTVWGGGGADGTYYAGINYNDIAGNYSMYQDWNSVIEGRTYNFSGYFTTHNGSLYSVIRLQFFNAANNQVGTTYEQEINTNYPNWTPVTWSAVAPTGAVRVRVTGYTQNTALKMDGISLETCFEPIIKFANLTGANICSGTSTTLNAVLSDPSLSVTYQWQFHNGTTWVNAVNGTSSTFTTAPLSATTQFRVNVTPTTGLCTTVSSSPVTVTVNTPPVVTVTTTNATVCVNSMAILTAKMAGGTGNFTYKWQESPNGTNNWVDIANETGVGYSLKTDAPSNKYYRVIVTTTGSPCSSVTSEGLNVKVENTAGCSCVLQSCSAYTKLIYKTPTQITDVAGLVGDRWRFSNIAAGFDAIVEITNATNANSLNAIDNIAVNVDDWCPEINFNFLPGQDSYVDWKITIVSTGTETPANLPTSSRVTSYDVDGNNKYREIHGHINSNGYILNNPSELTILNEPPFALVLGSTNEYTSISTDPKVKATFYYPGQNNVFTIRLGVRTTSETGAAFRQFAVSFDPCISYTNPDINPQTPEIAGTTATCVGGSNQTYKTTQPFTAYTWAVVGGTIVSGQSTRTIKVDWTSTGAKSVSISTIDANGCVGVTNLAITVTEDPSVSVNANTPNYVICQGQNTTLTATVTGGAGTPTFQWYSSTNNSTWDKIDGATASTYPVSGSFLGVKYYHIVVLFGNTGCSSTASSSTTVEVVAPLSISTPLVGFKECLGGTKKLEIVTLGGKNTTYQWQTSPNGANTWTNIDGETSVTYTPKSNAISTKYYRVVISSASSGCATIESPSVSVMVVADPIVIIGVSAQEICLGGNVVLTANVTDASASCSLQWISKTKETDWTPITGATGTTLTINALNNTTRYRVTLNCSGSGCCN
jgi:large repetitive protein